MPKLSLTKQIAFAATTTAAWIYDLVVPKVENESQPQEATIIASLIIAAVMFVIAELTKPSPHIEEARPKGLGDFKFPTATEGRPVSLVWGRVMLEGPNVVWYGDFQQVAVLGSFRKNLFSSKKSFVQGYKYRLGMQMVTNRGPIDALVRIFINKKQVWPSDGTSEGAQGDGTIQIDKPELFGGEKHGQGGVQADVDVFTGSLTQAISPYLSSHQDAGAGSNRTPRYSGSTYFIARELDAATALNAEGAYLGTTTTIKPWAFEVERFPPIFSGQGAGEHKVGNLDCNPINVAYELFTDPEWGLRQTNADIDLVAFKAAADVLRDELNGFSMALDRSMTASELLHEIERQIDGVFYLDHTSGKWTVKLARDDYDIDTVPQLNNTNISGIEEFTQGAYAATTNQVQVKFNKRAEFYKESFAFAQDMGNAIAQGSGTVISGKKVSTQEFYPGVKLSQLAADLAWRQLRYHAYPLVKATFTINRSFWDLHPGDVVAWTDADQGFVKLPMRVTRIDYGQLDASQIKISCIQDVFYTMDPSFGVPPDSQWVPSDVVPVAYPTDQQLAFEAPRAFRTRDPNNSAVNELEDTVAKIWCGARNQSGELGFQIHERHASGTPAGTYAEDTSEGSTRFVRIGSLKNALTPTAANPISTITLDIGPDTQATLQGEFLASAGPGDLGGDLLNLILVGNEFMIVTSAVNGAGTDITLQTIYRGLLDSTQQYHDAGTDVYYLFVGGTLTDTSFDDQHNVDVKLLSESRTDVLSIGSATAIPVALDSRMLRPYPPQTIIVDGADYATPTLEASGSGLNGFNNAITWARKDWNYYNEVDAILIGDRGNSQVGGAAISSAYQLEVRADPDGTNALVYLSPWITSGGGGAQVLRTAILRASPGAAAGADIRYFVNTAWASSGSGLKARERLEFQVTPTSPLTSQVALGARSALAAMAPYATTVTGSFVVNIGAVTASSDLQVSVNGGGWVTVIASGGTTGNVAIATIGHTIEFRHTINDSGLETFVELQNPSATPVAYGIITD